MRDWWTEMFSMLTLQLPENSVQAHYQEKLDHLAFAI